MCVYMHVIYPTPNPIKLCNRKQKTGDIVRDNICNVYNWKCVIHVSYIRQNLLKNPKRKTGTPKDIWTISGTIIYRRGYPTVR